MAQRRKSGFQISYVSITYRSVFQGILLSPAFVPLYMSFVYPDATAQTQVAVQVTTRTVDLATSNITPGSKSQVSVAGSVTNFAPNSAAQVINDPRNEQSSIFVTKGSPPSWSEEKAPIGVNEMLSIPAETDSKLVKTKELDAPVLINPTSPQISFGPGERGLTYSWSLVDDCRIWLARDQFFRPVYFERQITTQNAKGGFNHVSRPITNQ